MAGNAPSKANDYVELYQNSLECAYKRKDWSGEHYSSIKIKSSLKKDICFQSLVLSTRHISPTKIKYKKVFWNNLIMISGFSVILFFTISGNVFK